MKAEIKVVNPRRGRYAAEIERTGDFVIFELLDSSEPAIGDIVVHNDFYSMGRETYKNLTQCCEIEVAVENVCGVNQVRQKCFL